MSVRHLLAVCTLAMALAGCSGSADSQQPPTTQPPTAKPPTAAAAAPTAIAPAAQPTTVAANTPKPPATAAAPAPASSPQGCPVTLPNGSAPPNENPSPLFYGNKDLWTSLWAKGQVEFGPGNPGEIGADGSLSIRWSWWRGTNGNLAIEGKRLNGDAPPLKVIVPEGFGPTGFQTSTLVFPTVGCWQVTGKVGNASLTFVTLVILNK